MGLLLAALRCGLSPSDLLDWTSNAGINEVALLQRIEALSQLGYSVLLCALLLAELLLWPDTCRQVQQQHCQALQRPAAHQGAKPAGWDPPAGIPPACLPCLPAFSDVPAEAATQAAMRPPFCLGLGCGHPARQLARQLNCAHMKGLASLTVLRASQGGQGCRPLEICGVQLSGKLPDWMPSTAARM